MLLLVLLREPPEQPCNGLELFYLVYLNRKRSQDTKERRPDMTEMTLFKSALRPVFKHNPGLLSIFQNVIRSH